MAFRRLWDTILDFWVVCAPAVARPLGALTVEQTGLSVRYRP